MRIDVVPPPGSYRLQVLRPSAAGEQVVFLLKLSLRSAIGSIAFGQRLAGPFALVLDYIEDGEVT